MTETTILNKRAVSEIEARLKIEYERDINPRNRMLADIRSLCATVKHLREDAKSKKVELLQLSGRGELLAKEHVQFDSLDEVAAVRNEFDRLRNVVITELQSQLEQLRAAEQERTIAVRFLVKQGYARCAEVGHGCDGWHPKLPEYQGEM